ncbi:hypothetical protein KO494_03350 [Lacinutrix sp. C3R15]|uniref:hypothetical protein n=1 Tax=Flavobacteriaceae TaxID=49546 RepID=UPI001C09DCF0|nr:MULTISPECIES: hypothetical protein [Flavobacteriaceae]MBU2938568.1 hypothetical protein [Lacinutrix sp. C3R15]MDO6621882.1 hypothetical protein [Oceanihabitans sp. 1_MG-2023]
MKKLIIVLLVVFASMQTILAHNPLSAMYYLEVKENVSILNISLAQNGLDEALKKHYSNIDFETLPTVEYKQLAVKYLKENFNLHINSKSVALLEGGIKLGNHQTDAKFILSELPKNFKSLNVEVKAFIENNHHQTIFSLLFNENTSKVILNETNNYKSALIFKNNKMIKATKPFNKNYLWSIFIIPIFLFGKKITKKLKDES